MTVARSTSLRVLTALMLTSMAPAMADEAAPTLANRAIGYVMTNKGYASYETATKSECPNGLEVMGPREQFSEKFPHDGTPRAYLDTALAYESEVWFPAPDKDPYPIPKNVSKLAFGMNLDGKVGPNDFTSPDGEKGIDNQFYRALGCVGKFRSTDGGVRDNFNRIVIEITDVDSLENDDDVTVTTYRGLDPLLTDAKGREVLPRGTQRLDLRWGKEFIQHFRGKIANGVLETDAHDWVFPVTGGWEDVTVETYRDLRWRLSLTSNNAKGMMAGYVDVEKFYRRLNTTQSTHHNSYSQFAAPDIYRALRREADAYPDPKTGAFTAISAAFNVRFQQVFIEHPARATALNGNGRRDAKRVKNADVTR